MKLQYANARRAFCYGQGIYLKLNNDEFYVSPISSVQFFIYYIKGI